jgi:O-antigen ligase
MFGWNLFSLLAPENVAIFEIATLYNPWIQLSVFSSIVVLFFSYSFNLLRNGCSGYCNMESIQWRIFPLLFFFSWIGTCYLLRGNLFEDRSIYLNLLCPLVFGLVASTESREGICLEKWFFGTFPLLILGLCQIDWPNVKRFYYRGVYRETGIWDNPNTYGVFCGVVFTWGIAYLRESGFTIVGKWGGGKVVLFAALLLSLKGLLNSYSRGAWLGVAIAQTYLWTPAILSKIASGIQRKTYITIGVPLTCILIYGALLKLKDVDFPPLRRLGSIVNVTDLSWVHRLVAWKGSVLMLLERPIFGWGLENVESVYRVHFKPDSVPLAGAIVLNDVLFIAAGCGILVLILFVAILINTFRCIDCSAERSALCVLVTAAVFDGVLFNSSLALLFWLLVFRFVHNEPTKNAQV